MSVLDRVLGRIKLFTGGRTGDPAMARQGELDLALDQAERDQDDTRVADLSRERDGGSLDETRTRHELEAQAAELGIPVREEMTKRELAEAIEAEA
jgi:hypothetical protein